MPMSFNEDGFQFAWDATSLTNYMRCPRYYHFVNIEGWQPLEKSVHLIFGGHYATALEHYYKHVADGAEPMEALRLVIREALIATWEDGQPWDSGHNSKTRFTLIRTIIWYLDQYTIPPAEDLPVIQLDSGQVACELSFSVPLEGDYLWCGHIDRMVDHNGDPMVMDQKTTGSTISAYFFEQFSLDIQMSGYTYAGVIGYDIPVRGVIIDAAQIAVGFSRFARGFVTRSPSQLGEWQHTVMHYIEQARISHETGNYPMRNTSCNDYGKCSFRDICQRSPEHRNAFLEANFVKASRWDPLKQR